MTTKTTKKDIHENQYDKPLLQAQVSEEYVTSSAKGKGKYKSSGFIISTPEKRLAWLQEQRQRLIGLLPDGDVKERVKEAYESRAIKIQ